MDICLGFGWPTRITFTRFLGFCYTVVEFFCSFGNVLQHRLLPPSGTTVKNEYSRASTSIMCVCSRQGRSCLIFNTDVVIRPAIASFVEKNLLLVWCIIYLLVTNYLYILFMVFLLLSF